MNDFGPELRRWRDLRRLSQLELAMDCGVSPRHLSFLETGRANPSRDMIERLGGALDVPLEGRNAMLQAAGFAARHPVSDLSADHMARVREATLRIVDRHAPYPGMAFDADWRLVRINAGAAPMLAPLGVGEGDSLLAPLLRPGLAAAFIENWDAVGAHLLHRLRAEVRSGGPRPALTKAMAALEADPVVQRGASQVTDVDPVMPTIYRAGDMRLAFFSTLLTFLGAQDVAVQSLRIELLFPADAETEATYGWARGTDQ
ncbi:helix-turn-helix domain-containing protein [Jannaschia pohangensis]|uniref:Transcriptional regulator, contains XRE-family HTH domain n=1 Tax=Jannaschia pohangensis TaxID=390807 RepID=A0A1I3GM00_9RHOB|nr:helix-turn-helix domain-containing protein [Jannaschia pohangensis]SFI24517.1 Transcriptional regulator, contains XRE-family HTH domain [Jannaschia pohangensis]